ncbi:MAG TPA: hypothetical protein PKV35_05310, partial [bacterium]|nr:hypothetical protein [bacterium]
MIIDIKELEKNALKFWPDGIAEMERNSSIIPKLIETQDKFISLLNIADAEPYAWKKVLENSKQLSANLFLKHLIVLSDISGEKLMRFKTELPKVFENDTMEFSWNGRNYLYEFQTLSGKKTWNNKHLKVDGVGLTTAEELNPIIEDITNLILFGGSAIADNIPNEIEEKCNIGTLIGQKKELDAFVRQRYIWVSRITGGAAANSLGNLAQRFVVEFLQERLPKWDFSKKHIDKISQNKRTLLSYDIVAKSPKGKICAIEVSFQVTTNSTIERKAGQAQARQIQLKK